MNSHPLVAAYIKTNKFGDTIGMDFDINKDGEVQYRMDINEKHLATPLAAHGGAISALMDATMGVCALCKVMYDSKVVSTLEMKISFLAPVFNSDKLLGTAEVIKSGKRILFVEGNIKNQEGKLVAIASGTFNSYPAEKAGIRI